jgi:ribosomal protein L11 methyltransferase
MAYYEFTITKWGNSKDALLNRMSEMGCLGITDKEERIIAYFKDTHDIITLRDELNSFREILKESGLDSDFSFDYLYLSERDWNEPWKKRFIPIDVGDHLSILPPWETVSAGRIALVIDPGMAFGTGHHETTKRCLILIEKYATTTLPLREGITPPSPPLNLRGGWVGSY